MKTIDLILKCIPLYVSFILLGLTSCETTQSSSVDSPRQAQWISHPSHEFRGAWIYDPRNLDPDSVMRSLKNQGFNAVFVRLSSAGAAYYPSKVLPKAPGTRENYAQIYADLGRKYGIKVHAWHVCFMMHNADWKSVKSAINNGEVMRDDRGRALRPTYNVPVRTPALNSNRLLEKNAIVELVRDYDLDGVQLDYIRYFSPKVDYSATSRAAYEKYIGRKVARWPGDVTTGRLRKSYHDWRAELISSLVGEVSQSVKTVRPDAKVSAAVWHSADIAYHDYAQDWINWVNKGYLDFVVPMNYTRDDAVFVSWIRKQKELIQDRIPLYSGIGAYMFKSPTQLNRQVAMCREAGLKGYVLYSLDEMLKTDMLRTVSN